MTDKLKFQSIHDQIKDFKEKMNKKPIHRQDEDMVMNANFNRNSLNIPIKIFRGCE